MNIAFDVTPLFSPHKFRGIGSYTKNLADLLPTIDKENKYLFFKKGENIQRADIIHHPYFDLFFLTLPLFKKFPTVVTIYDVIPLIFKNHFPSGIRGQLKFLIQKLALKNVAKVITISQNSKKDIQNYLGVPEEKIAVSYLAPSPIFKLQKDKNRLEKIRKKYGLPKEFILYVGDLNYNKNLPNLFQALKGIEIPLVMVGKASKEEKLMELQNLLSLANNLSIQRRILRVGYVPDEDLIAIYNLAKVYVQPSLYEGFGLPVLDAMASGTPVVCANSSSLPEVANEAVIYFDPNNAKDIERGVKEALNLNPLERKSLIEKGFLQAKKFSWERCAKETVKIYQEILRSND